MRDYAAFPCLTSHLQLNVLSAIAVIDWLDITTTQVIGLTDTNSCQR